MLEILILSFFVALSGALMPGPLLTYTIFKSVKEKRGYLNGIYILLGHATIELALILILLAGASFFFKNLLVLILIGVVGGTFLIIFGSLSIKDSLKIKNDYNLLQSPPNYGRLKKNSYLGGILVTISNPFWEFWWAFTGLTFMLEYNITFLNPIGLILFFIGHELGDIIWYLPISISVSFGRRTLNSRLYKYILIFCGIFLIGFGLFLMLNIIFSTPPIN
jgi:threonine/homoserine/homoserine lactone efflux protein